MWVLSHKDLTILQFRLVLDMLQVLGLQVLVPSLEPEWFVVRAHLLLGCSLPRCRNPPLEFADWYAFTDRKRDWGWFRHSDVAAIPVPDTE